MQILFDTYTETSAIIPQAIFDYLPFSEEPLSRWDYETDILGFLCDLYEGTGYRDYGQSLYERGQSEFRDWAQRFLESALKAPPAPGAAKQTIEVPDFVDEPVFGWISKYMIALTGVVSNLLSESAFFSLAHLLESQEDLYSSILLAAHLHYKQAMQILRGFIENLVLPIHFCGHPQDFLDWKSDNYRVPSLRRSGGLLDQLVEAQTISEEVATRISDLYGELNGYIHGSERRLVHKGLHTGNWMGSVFKYDDFCEWGKAFSHSVDLGIRLLRINLAQWGSIKPMDKVICSICHSDEFDTEEEQLGESRLMKYHCRICNNEMTITPGGRRIVVVTTRDNPNHEGIDRILNSDHAA